MSDISNESTTVPQPSLNNPIITDSSKISPTTLESHSVQITMISLNGDNFLRWSQSVRMYIRGRGKMGYLMGEKKAPAVDDPNYAIWDAENSWGRIIGRQSLPSIGEVFSEVRREESRRNVMLGKKGPRVAIEGSTLVTMGGGYNKVVAFQRKSNERPRAETSTFTTEQMEHLLALLKSNSTSGTPSVSVAHTGNELYAPSCRFKSTPWIIDSGASNHMTNSSNMFESYSPCPGNKKDRSSGKTIGSARMINEEEILRIKKNRNNLEPVVYSRKKVSGRSKDQLIIPAHGQPKALGNGSLNASGNPPFVPAPIHTSSSPVTDLSLLSHFDPSPEISAPEPGLGLAPVVPAQDLDLDLPIALRKGTRACTKHPIAKYISYSNLSDNYRAFTTNISKLVVPRNIQEALDEPSWKLAVFEEMNALKKNGTWEVVDLPKEKKVVGCKWVFMIKSKADGSVERYKARLVAKATKAKNVKDRDRYQRLVGRLIYLFHTHLDIAFSVEALCLSHEDTYKLKPTPMADWARSIVDRRSTSGYFSFVGDNLVTWRSKKQNVVARSSAEVEFRAVAHVICEIMWIRRLLEELKMTGSSPMKLYCDNKAAILVAHNLVSP
ncbi:Retrovirus-related Pol polyprotein from transposon RE2 [Vitis vinifera]|uniref:Retrovirus-related Pol polyprotein from transposon RE2 n=2 Tax=Vitis vinifera TaxID=29760 RepID=A0A438DGC9_VITVI|nr:Retrovirus-related Pol polyprotein from transposon RE2 [Vitis vinifera]